MLKLRTGSYGGWGDVSNWVLVAMGLGGEGTVDKVIVTRYKLNTNVS